MNVLQKWMSVATPEEKRELAFRAITTVGALRQAAGGYKTGGKLALTPEFAARIIAAADYLHRKGLPILHKGDLCPACRECKFYKQCNK